MCRECFPGPATQPASLLPHVHGFPALRVLPASPTSTVASVSLRLIHSVDILGPFSTNQDGGGSPRCHDASVSVHAVLLDPAGVSSDHRPLRSPTFAFQIFDPVGLRMCHEAPSLYLRYGLDIALSTLNSCRLLHELKTRFPVGRLIPLSGTGISPAESARLSLAHRKILPMTSKPGSYTCSGISMGATYLLPMRCPAYRRHDSYLGSRRELENRVGDDKGLCQEDEQSSCCAKDGGRPSGAV